MTQERKFKCKVEELFFISEFVMQSYKRDIEDFERFSPVFSHELVDVIREKLEKCKGVIFSSVIIKQLKATTEKLEKTLSELRKPLNLLEGYLKLAEKDLDIPVKSMGLHEIRKQISLKNTEGVVICMYKLLTPVERNINALIEVGMNETLLEELRKINQIISSLNVEQDELMSQRNQLTEENMVLFNELWDSFQPILKTAQALYKLDNPVKMKDYTITQLLKKLNKEQGKNKKENN